MNFSSMLIFTILGFPPTYFQRYVGSAFIVVVQSLSLYKSTHTMLFWYFIYRVTIWFYRFEVLVCSKEVSKVYKLTLEICEKNMQLRWLREQRSEWAFSLTRDIWWLRFQSCYPTSKLSFGVKNSVSFINE